MRQDIRGNAHQGLHVVLITVVYPIFPITLYILLEVTHMHVSTNVNNGPKHYKYHKTQVSQFRVNRRSNLKCNIYIMTYTI